MFVDREKDGLLHASKMIHMLGGLLEDINRIPYVINQCPESVKDHNTNAFYLMHRLSIHVTKLIEQAYAHNVINSHELSHICEELNKW